MPDKKRATKTKKEILDTTWRLIAKHGAEVSISQIAQAAGVSRQAIYLHFGTRGGLLMALVKRADERFRIFEDFATALQTQSPIRRLDACLYVWLTFVDKILPVAKDLIRLRATDEDASAAWEDRMVDARALIIELTNSLEADSVLSPTFTPAEAADYIWAASSVQIWDLLTIERRWPPNRAIEVMTASIRHAVLC